MKRNCFNCDYIKYWHTIAFCKKHDFKIAPTTMQDECADFVPHPKLVKLEEEKKP
jgi:hypothetical protein